MIYKAIKFIESKLNDFLKIESNVVEPIAVTNNLMNADGSVPPNNENKLVVTFLNLAEESLLKNLRVPNAGIINKKRKTDLSFYLLISSNFIDYLEGVRFLDAAYSFFENNAIFNETISENFPTDIDKIQLHFQTTSFEQLNFIWSTLGARYQPSIMYKVNLLYK